MSTFHGFWGRTGGARIDTLQGCTGGGCRQGDYPDLCDCELACDLGPDAERVIQPPPPLPDDMRSRMVRRALYVSALLMSLMAGLLEAFGASPFTRNLP